MKMSELEEIKNSWEELFKIRRMVEKNDLECITDGNVRTNLHNMWMAKSTNLYLHGCRGPITLAS